MKNLIGIFVVLLILASCVSNPEKPVDNGNISPAKTGVFILCEGIYKNDNSGITRYLLNGGEVTNRFYSQSNPGMKLGDLANSIVIKGDTAFVAVSSSNTIESFRVSDGKSQNRLILEGDPQPRKLAIINDTLGFFTNFNSSSVTAFNPSTMKKIADYQTGPVPEGLAAWQDKLFVANSGAGDLLKDKPGAGTIWVMDMFTGAVINKTAVLPNVYELLADTENNLLYARYLHYYSEPDSLGGIVCFDLNGMKELYRWRDRTASFGKAMALADGGKTLYYLNDKGVAKISTGSSADPQQFIINPNNKKEFWYSLAVSPDGKEIWVGNAMNYQINGQVLVYNISSPDEAVKIINVGVNPNAIVFY